MWLEKREKLRNSYGDFVNENIRCHRLYKPFETSAALLAATRHKLANSIHVFEPSSPHHEHEQRHVNVANRAVMRQGDSNAWGDMQIEERPEQTRPRAQALEKLTPSPRHDP